jgi:hypothetical protein
MENRSNDFMEKFKGLGLGGQIIVIAALVLLIDSFLDWYSVSASFGDIEVSASASGWDAPGAIWSILAVLIGLAMGGVTVARALMAPGTIPDNISGFTWPKIMLGAGGVAALFIIIKFLNHSGDLAFGFFIGIICVAALCAGGFLQFQEEQKGTAAG